MKLWVARLESKEGDLHTAKGLTVSTILIIENSDVSWIGEALRSKPEPPQTQSRDQARLLLATRKNERSKHHNSVKLFFTSSNACSTHRPNGQGVARQASRQETPSAVFLGFAALLLSGTQHQDCRTGVFNILRFSSVEVGRRMIGDGPIATNVLNLPGARIGGSHPPGKGSSR